MVVVDVVEKVAIKKVDKDAISQCRANHTSILAHLSKSCVSGGARKLAVHTSPSVPRAGVRCSGGVADCVGERDEG
jgi:hypothetical protein